MGNIITVSTVLETTACGRGENDGGIVAVDVQFLLAIDHLVLRTSLSTVAHTVPQLCSPECPASSAA